MPSSFADHDDRSTRALARLVALSPDPLAVVEPDGRCRQVNAAAERALGWPADALCARTLVELAHPDDRAAVAAAWAAVVAGAAQTLEHRVVAADGSVRWIAWQLAPDAELGAVLAAGRDTTALRHAEAALRQSEARRAWSAENAPGFVYQFVYRPDGTRGFVAVSDGARTLFGVEPDDILRDRAALFDLIHPDDRAGFYASGAASTAALTPWRWEGRVVLPNGDVKWMQGGSQPVPQPDGSILCDGVFVDVTERHETAARLREREHWYRSLFEQHPDAVFALDLQGRFLSVNPMCVAISGFAADELLGRSFAPLVEREDLDAAWEHFQAAVDGDAGARSLRIRHRAGHVVELEVTRMPIVIDGEVVGAFGIAKDLTARRALEDQLRRSDRRFRAVVERAAERISIVDADGTLLYANPAHLRSLGLSAEEALGISAFGFVHPDDRAEMRARFAELLRTPGAVATVEYRTGHPAAGWRTVRTVGTNLLDDPAVGGVVLNSIDVTDERDAVAALRTSEERLRLTFEHAGIGMVLCTLDGRFERVNAALCAFLGYTEEELRGMSRMDRTHPDDRAIDAEQTAQLVAGVISKYDVEKRYVRKDGSVRWGLLTVSLLRDAAGAPMQVIAQVQDIAERHRAEEALRESEARFRALVERAPDGVVVVGDEGAILFANPAAARIFHATDAAALVGRRAADLVDPESATALLAAVADARPRGASASMTADRLRRLDGSLFEAEVATTTVVYEGRAAVQVAVRDVTALKSAEAEVRRQALVFETIGDAVIVMDARGVIVDWNPGAERMYGYAKREMLGRSPTVFHHPELGDTQEATIQDALARERRWAGEIRFVRKDGREGIADVVVVNQYDAAGAIVARIGINRDVTERRALEAQLRQAQKMEAVGRLAGGVAHDFNNLLTVINGNLEFARDDLGPDHPVQDDLSQVAQAAERAQALVRQLLAFGRQQVLQPRRLDVNETVRSVAAMLRRVIGEDIALETELAPVWPVHVDPGQLEQVVMNLAVNARDAMPDGGTLRLRTAAVEVGPAEARARPGLAPGQYASLVVEDTGVGIDAAVRPRVFDPFFTTKGPGKGTGLGLATVHGIVVQSGGSVAVESVPGRGSRFTVLLPRAPEPDAAAARPADGAPAAGGREIVLLVEDEPAVRGTVRRQLERAGYVVREAGSGADALGMAASPAEQVDVVVTDVVMPEQSGRLLAERLAELRPELPVVFMSGYTDDEIVRRGLLVPGAVLLQKPFTPEQLAAAVRAALDARRARPA